MELAGPDKSGHKGLSKEGRLTQPAFTRSWYIVVEGAIGVGKTTLARMLRDYFGTSLLLEVFEENPFLAKFYESRAQYAFQTQMFFLLSRYRQQQQIPQLLQQGPLISDYMFSKDRLFAQLNLEGDEWEIYQQIQAALAGQTVPPDLIVYLQADTDVLMERITHRDRPYERSMDRDYIEALRQVYEHYLPQQQNAPVLTVDTNQINFVANPADLHSITERIRTVLKEGLFQQPLPYMEGQANQEEPKARSRPLAEYQRYHDNADRGMVLSSDPYFNFLCLSQEVGELGSTLTGIRKAEFALTNKGQSPEEAREQVFREWRHAFRTELAECMICLLKMSNLAGIDLEDAYLEKANLNHAS